jgi:hypothetical protein
MKSALQIQLDNQYEVLRVVYLRQKEQAAPVVHTLSLKRLLQLPVREVTSPLVQAANNWDESWYSHYE